MLSCCIILVDAIGVGAHSLSYLSLGDHAHDRLNILRHSARGSGVLSDQPNYGFAAVKLFQHFLHNHQPVDVQSLQQTLLSLRCAFDLGNGGGLSGTILGRHQLHSRSAYDCHCGYRPHPHNNCALRFAEVIPRLAKGLCCFDTTFSPNSGY